MRKLFARKFLSLLTTVAIATTGMAITATPAQAAGTTCRTLNLTQGFTLGLSIRPRMTVPVCYNGSRIWVNGNVTPGVTASGYSVGGFDWYGTYGGPNWLGAGENFSATIWTGAWSFYCTPRWYINSWGNVYSYNRGC